MTTPKIFVSYSHADIKWLTRLEKLLRPMVRADALRVWADKDIKPGDRWRNAIEQELRESRLALLLVSSDFLASDFIATNELPPLLHAAGAHGLRILWAHVSASAYVKTPIAEYQCLHDPSRPLDTLALPKRNQTLVAIAEQIGELAQESRGARPLARPEPAPTTGGVARGALDSLMIEFTGLALSDLATLAVDKESILRLLAGEFQSHPILGRIDYEFAPRPLKDGFFSVISKSGSNVLVEHVSRCVLSPDKIELWSDLCESYLNAYRLPFRTDHVILLNGAEFERTRHTLHKLLADLNKYVYQTRIFHDQEVFPRLHKMKANAESSYLLGEKLYSELPENVDKRLGEVALHFDQVVSIVHKIILEYHCRA